MPLFWSLKVQRHKFLVLDRIKEVAVLGLLPAQQAPA